MYMLTDLPLEPIAILPSPSADERPTEIDRSPVADELSPNATLLPGAEVLLPTALLLTILLPGAEASLGTIELLLANVFEFASETVFASTVWKHPAARKNTDNIAVVYSVRKPIFFGFLLMAANIDEPGELGISTLKQFTFFI
ncbi:hypothetical protein A7318_28065 (plasmid) [Pseudomonas lurida]|nr:hypothetical protein A7318_28065 [Pseudomonas lurida]